MHWLIRRISLRVKEFMYLFRLWLRRQIVTMKLLSSLMGIFFLSFFLVAPSFADEKIICKVKGVGQRIFLLDSGIFSSKVLLKNQKVILSIGVQKQSLKSHHLDGGLPFVNCLEYGFKINLSGARQ